MQHHRSIGTTTLVALMAAHREAEGRAPRREAGTPVLDPREIDRLAERLWRVEAPPGPAPRLPSR